MLWKSAKLFTLGGDLVTPPVWPPGPRRPSTFKSPAISSLQKGVNKSKSSIVRSSAESEATIVPQSAQNGDSKPRSRPHDIRQTSAQDADASGATSTDRLRNRCALHPQASPSELQALQANAPPDKVLEWLDSPVPFPFLNLGNDGIASETTVFTSQGPLSVSYVEEQLRWWSQCSCSDRYSEWTRFAILARYSIGQDFRLTPIKRPIKRSPPKTDFKTKLITYLRRS
ncbi:hypothetical protein M407DRAFT_23912 [Tulasnella calospora MUT 4182]|uniref:Uncharacterized protein n=1 Tax=Tulasnella calospora MUT 4182 TaxID=1051891 RepID=A0A0C3QKE9_9AGAM|nr:hypothetical protein M407DRAFT_23912 [Tulasnella calospora MUT 4182]